MTESGRGKPTGALLRSAAVSSNGAHNRYFRDGSLQQFQPVGFGFAIFENLSFGNGVATDSTIGLV